MTLVSHEPSHPCAFNGWRAQYSRKAVSKVCPRCGTSLTTLTLRGTTAVNCERCGFVGVNADHSGEPQTIESWDQAMNRFQEVNHIDNTGVDADADEKAEQTSGQGSAAPVSTEPADDTFESAVANNASATATEGPSESEPAGDGSSHTDTESEPDDIESSDSNAPTDDERPDSADTTEHDAKEDSQS